jgi:undecaprenyl-diphosphatase
VGAGSGGGWSGRLPGVTSLVDAVLAAPPWLVLVLVFALPAVEASAFVGLVVPGEIAVLVGGVVAHGGGLPLGAVIAAAVAGAAVGDQVGFLVGRRYGRGLLGRLPARARRSGEIDRALSMVRRRGALAVVLGRWVAALRALVPGIAGMSGMAQGRFTVANVTGGTLWAATVAVAGYAAGASYRVLERRLGLGGEAALAVVVLAGVVWVVRARRAAGSGKGVRT